MKQNEVVAAQGFEEFEALGGIEGIDAKAEYNSYEDDHFDEAAAWAKHCHEAQFNLRPLEDCPLWR